ncbi:MAG: S49 family peptidase [Aliidongia sp.]
MVLRIDSPGGSGTASESIWRAVKRAQEAHKPVIVSMGNVAASGGYYIACGADKIVADPGTVTGSIGVFSGKFVMAGLFDKLGVTVDTLSYGRDAGIDSSQTEFTPEQTKHFNEMLDDFYHTFVARVAEGRHLDPVKAEAIARGPGLDRRAGQGARAGRCAGWARRGDHPGQAGGQSAGDKPIVLRSFRSRNRPSRSWSPASTMPGTGRPGLRRAAAPVGPGAAAASARPVQPGEPGRRR